MHYLADVVVILVFGVFFYISFHAHVLLLIAYFIFLGNLALLLRRIE